MLQEIKIVNFRNFGAVKLDFSGRDAILSGRNGSGKSNLLEAVHHLSILRSFRGARSREMVKIGETEFFLGGNLKVGNLTEFLSVRERSDGRRELFLGETKVRRSSEFIGEFQAVPFVPEDRMIVSGNSGFRRKFFDILLSALDENYFVALVNYTRALDQRNRALRENHLNIAAAFEEELSRCGVKIGVFRENCAQKIVDEMNRLLGKKYRFDLRYLRAFPGSEEEYRDKLKSQRQRELLKKCTLTGPQLDEFEMRLDGKLLRGFSSTGQQRLTSLMLRLAHFNLVRKNASAPVVALVDDVTGELDDENLDRFLENIAVADQRIFTFTGIPDREFFRRCQIIPVEKLEQIN